MLQPPPQTQAQAQVQPAASNNMSENAAPPTVPVFTSAPTEEQKPLLTEQQHFMQARSGAGFQSPEVAAQMQKLISTTGMQPQTFSPKPRPTLPPPSGPIMQLQPQLQPQASTSSGGSKRWEGSFTFTALQHGQPKGLEVQVTVIQSTGELYVINRSLLPSVNPSGRHAETWPDRIPISISKEGLKDRTELQAWIQQHQHTIAIVQFKPQARNIDQKLNEMFHVLLMKIMAERRTVSAPLHSNSLLTSLTFSLP